MPVKKRTMRRRGVRKSSKRNVRKSVRRSSKRNIRRNVRKSSKRNVRKINGKVLGGMFERV